MSIRGGWCWGGGELVFSYSSGSLCGPRSWHPESFASDWCLGLNSVHAEELWDNPCALCGSVSPCCMASLTALRPQLYASHRDLWDYGHLAK